MINAKNLQAVINDSKLKNNTEKENTGKIMIYNVPENWIKTIHNNSMSVSRFAKNAIEAHLKANGLI